MDNPENKQEKHGPVSQHGGKGPSLRSKMRSGALFLSIGNIVSKLAKVVVVAWQLELGDFGVVAMAAAFMMLLQMFSEFGIVPAIIQRKDLSERYTATAFWAGMVMSTLMMGIAWMAAPWLARFYEEPLVANVVRVSSLGFVLLALRMIPMALLRKRLRFARYALLDTAWQISTCLLTLVFAVAGAQYWSLVIPQLITGVLILPFWFHAVRWLPGLCFDTQIFREIFKFSKNVLLVTIGAFALNGAGFMLAGRLLGTEPAGVYKFSIELAMFVTFNFAWMVSNVVVSGFALAQDDSERLRRAFGRVYDVLFAVTLPLHVLLFVQADLVFTALFPDKWLGAIPILRILLLCGVMRSLGAPITQYYYATNRSHVNVWFMLVQVVTLLPAMYFGCVLYGMGGLAFATSTVFSAVVAGMFFLIPRLNGWEPLGYVKRSAPWLVASIVLAGVAYGVAHLLASVECPTLLNLLFSSLTGVLAYPLAVFLCARNHFNQLVEEIVPERIRNVYAGAATRGMDA